MTKISKEYKWEMSHRLTFHDGGCKNIHGHSYIMRVDMLGELNDQGMILDFYDVDKLFMPLINKFDHAFVVDENDSIMLPFLIEQGFKHLIVPKFTTVENLVSYIIETVRPQIADLGNIQSLTVRLFETEDAFAEETVKI